jgi:outer membrane protein assembly factor BamB
MKSYLYVLGLILTLSASAQDFVGWRTDGSGAYTTATPPTEWSKTKNVIWSTPLTDSSNATPVISGEKLFICAEPETLICINLADGKILWQKTNTETDVSTPEELEKAKQAKAEYDPILKEKAEAEKVRNGINQEVGAADKEIKEAGEALKKNAEDADAKKKQEDATKKKDEAKKRQVEANAKVTEITKKLDPYMGYMPPHTHGTNGYSTCTPATDGKNVFVIFGNGVVASYDFEGKRVWARRLDKPKHDWGHSASPVLADQKLVVHITDMLGLNPATGETVWTAKVPCSFGSPSVVKIGDVSAVMTAAGDLVRASDGKVLAPHVARLSYNGPLVSDGVVYFVDEGGSKAVKLPEKAADAVTLEQVWTGKFEKDQRDRYYASPVSADGILYVVNQKGVFSALDAKTGTTIYEKPLGIPGTFYPSVTLAGKYVFVSSDSGTTVVVETGKEFKEVARNSLEGFRSCPVFAGKRAYIRGAKALYCIGEP